MGDDGDRNRRRHVDPVIRRMLGDVRGRTLLDAGCGTGSFPQERRVCAAVTGRG